MLKCQHPKCEFEVTEEFHQILTGLISSNDSTLEIKLTRSDFLRASPNTSPKKIQKSSPEIKEENKTEPKRLEQKKSRLIHNSRLSSGNITQLLLPKAAPTKEIKAEESIRIEHIERNDSSVPIGYPYRHPERQFDGKKSNLAVSPTIEINFQSY
jgi:hypothetical protein